VVVAIIGIMTAIVAPRFSATFSRATLGGTARHLVGTMAYLRNVAAKEGRSYFLNIDLDKNKYSASYIKDDVDLSQLGYEDFDFLTEEIFEPVNDAFVKPTRLKKKIVFARVILEDGTDVYEGIARIELRPDGTADETIIHLTKPNLTNPKEKGYTVHLEHYNGQARVCRGHLDLEDLSIPVLTEREPSRRPEDAL